MKVGQYEVKIVKKLEQKRKSYPLCDKQGNLLENESVKGTREYKTKEGVLVTETFRLINGRAMQKFKKTDVVTKFEEVDRLEVYDLRVEEYYFCESESLKTYLKDKDTALKFIYTNGNGFRGYISYLTIFKDNLIMVCGFGQLSDLIEQIRAEREANAEVKKEEVERANPEELMLEIPITKQRVGKTSQND
jgi:hypothetical protein